MYIDLYADYRRGHLPFNGCRTQQPIKIMEIFDIIERAEREIQKERDKLLDRIADDGRRTKN